MPFPRTCAALALSALTFACSGSETDQDAPTAVGGSTQQGSSTGGAASGGGPGAGAGVGGTTTFPTTGGALSNGGSSAGSKRGIAANVAPGAAFSPTVRWWYNWALKSTGTDVGLEFVPMIWNQTTVSSALPSGSKFVLGFNEPNFFVQANLSPTQAASYWPALQTNAASAGLSIVGPAMNFCGPAAQCHGTDPYQYLKDFFVACKDCKVDYIAVHWYNCDLPSLRDYLEPGGNLEGFEQFGKPVWLTEFSCDGSATVAQQEAFMRAAIPYLEGNPQVYRYSWFSADPIPSAKLVNADGTPTALGKVYIDL